MDAFITHNGTVVPIDRANIDTDAIIPKQFLKRIERTGFGQFLFYDWKYLDNGDENLEFEVNQPRYEGASILLARQNFGCGSSREHAPWALLDHGFKVIIAPSFADIFYNNCFKNGILPIQLSEAQVQQLFEKTEQTEGYKLDVDLEQQKVTDNTGFEATFDVDPFRKEMLLKGLDDIGLTLLQQDKITQFEQKAFV
ncbi:3-isopropylmalate dehydratase small subunit [Bacillus horti]|uniref:3-isopropylmalate dehydratase small subunit n=1 Tax=Caldalkalibacillus horti TaxID=77523 RepID=A0ABT9W1W8_9BACI|nr:3-isopropylmalate dehydratase small subunit [Bacillus horti]MDQ0167244.1 3-isopropylmalate/(R)-2-methylmalate dehydratase small subunit [Bacillus horti]